MVDVFDPIVKPYEPAIDLFGQSSVVLAIRILIELVGVPKPSGSQRSILGRGHQVRVGPEVNTQRLASVEIRTSASQLYASSANEPPGIPTCLISVAHPVAVDDSGNELWISLAGLGLFSIKALGPCLHQSGSRI